MADREPTTNDILAFMDDDERADWDSGRRNSRRTKSNLGKPQSFVAKHSRSNRGRTATSVRPRRRLATLSAGSRSRSKRHTRLLPTAMEKVSQGEGSRRRSKPKVCARIHKTKRR